MSVTFNDAFLEALGAWQRGWRENQDLRLTLATQLESLCQLLPDVYRRVAVKCYRKRFINEQDWVMLFLNEHLDDGITSWTIDRTYAEDFKGIVRGHPNSGAVFAGLPPSDECLVSLPALWANPNFREAVRSYADRDAANADALINFADKQGEVVLSSQLRLDELVGVTGTSSPFEQLAARAGISDAGLDDAWRFLVESETIPEEARFIRDDAVKRAVGNIREWLVRRLTEVGIDPAGPPAALQTLLGAGKRND